MKISLVTIVRNGESHIERTIRSVIEQRDCDIEYILIDGASTDATMDVVQRYRAHFAHVVSEPDRGISDAWNKGIALCTGDAIGLLNAGDEHLPHTVARAAEAIKSGNDFVYGNTALVTEDGLTKRLNRGRFHLWRYSAGFGFYHPSCFATRELYGRVGGFDLRLRYAMDSDWICRAVFAGARVGKHAGMTRMVDGGISVQRRFAAYGEHLDALSQGGQHPWLPLLSMAMTAARGAAARFRRSSDRGR